MPEFPAELLPQLLKTETSSRAANADYLAFYQKSPLSIDRLRFVRDSYKDIFTELLLDGDTRVGFHRQEDGLLVWQGAYLTRSAETLLPWRAVANALNDLIGQQELTAALDVKALPQENAQLSFALPEDAHAVRKKPCWRMMSCAARKNRSAPYPVRWKTRQSGTTAAISQMRR